MLDLLQRAGGYPSYNNKPEQGKSVYVEINKREARDARQAAQYSE